MKSMAEEFKKREDMKPDQWTLAWWRNQFEEVAKGYRGATHAMNLVLARLEDRDAEVKELQTQLRYYAEGFHEVKVAIGKLEESMEKSREAYSELKKQVAS